MKVRKVEDRTIVATFDVSDGSVVTTRYHLTTANTVIVQECYASDRQQDVHTYERAFPTMTEALARIIENTGFGMVVEHLTSWEDLNA